MHISSQAKAEADSSPGWGTTPGISTRWLVGANSGMRGGAVAIVTIEPGARQPLHRHPGAEEASIVLEGSGGFLVGHEEAEAVEGVVFHAPTGAAHAVRAGADGVTLLVLLGGAADPALAGWEEEDSGSGPAAVTLDSRDREEQVINDASRGFHGMNTRWLIDPDITPSESLMVGRVRYEPGGLHDLHKHPDTDEFFFLLSGEGSHFGGAETEYPVVPGEIAAMAADEWHGFRNTGGELFAIFGFLGVPDFPSAGYVLADPTVR